MKRRISRAALVSSASHNVTKRSLSAAVILMISWLSFRTFFFGFLSVIAQPRLGHLYRYDIIYRLYILFEWPENPGMNHFFDVSRRLITVSIPTTSKGVDLES